MKTFFTVKTAAYEGPELGPTDTVSVEIQRYDALGLIKSREKLVAMVVNVEPIFPIEPDRLAKIIETDNAKMPVYRSDDPGDAGPLTLGAQIEANDEMFDEKLTDYYESREGPLNDEEPS